MTNFLWVMFITSTFILIWVYFGYGTLLFLICQVRPKPHPTNPEEWPAVTILIPTYKEAGVIEEKLHNTFDLVYPEDRREIIVINDESGDRTQECVKRYCHRGVKLLNQSVRQGKAAAINRGLQVARGDIIVVTDANAFISADALKKIVRHFQDSSVGAVTGSMRQLDRAETPASKGGDLYWRMEKLMRECESRLASVVSMSGEISAFRRSIFWNGIQVRPWYIHGGTDDFQMTLTIIRHGMKVRYEPEANVWEPAPSTIQDLFSQKVRIITQTIVTVWHNRTLIFSGVGGWYGPFIFFSRRALPLLTPFALLFALISSAALAFNSPIALWLFIFQFAGYLIALTGLSRRGERWFITRTLAFGLLLHATITLAWIRLFQGRDYTVWETIKSSRVS